ncbi:5595_t:CDS:1 [Ambispora leptoticha]|uniref:Voltage-gated hydrogen channel 1 n=1 Tax=Ambispora leptoticha TaxID=144679 RepID=A0A9N9H9B1_9GLOM|nr:5595_t:CDS:1 [Ambispora leptoticha]
MSYGTIPTSPDESSTNSSITITLQPNDKEKTDKSKLRETLAEFLESRKAHWLILLLVAADFLTVMTVIIISLYDPKKEDSPLVEQLLDLAFVINSIFVIEVILKLIVFGFSYFCKGEFGLLHGFDAFIVVATFVLEVFLKGKEAELVELLLLFRLWRVIKVVGAVAIGVAEYDEAHDSIREDKMKKLRATLRNVLGEVNTIAVEDQWTKEKKARVFDLVDDTLFED